MDRIREMVKKIREVNRTKLGPVENVLTEEKCIELIKEEIRKRAKNE